VRKLRDLYGSTREKAYQRGVASPPSFVLCSARIVPLLLPKHPLSQILLPLYLLGASRASTCVFERCSPAFYEWLLRFARAEPDYGERRSQRTLAALAHQAGIASPTYTLNHCSALQALALVTSAVYLTVTNIATVQRERVRENSAFNVLTAGSPGFTTFAFLVLTFPGKSKHTLNPSRQLEPSSASSATDRGSLVWIATHPASGLAESLLTCRVNQSRTYDTGHSSYSTRGVGAASSCILL